MNIVRHQRISEDDQAMSEREESMTPEELRTRKALTALEEMARLWAEEVGLTEMSARIATSDNREFGISAIAEQAFIEGAYRCFLDAVDGKIPSFNDIVEVARLAGWYAGRDAAKAAQPATAEDPNESNYQRGYFDGVMAYASAIRSLEPIDSEKGERK